MICQRMCKAMCGACAAVAQHLSAGCMGSMRGKPAWLCVACFFRIVPTVMACNKRMPFFVSPVMGLCTLWGSQVEAVDNVMRLI